MNNGNYNNLKINNISNMINSRTHPSYSNANNTSNNDNSGNKSLLPDIQTFKTTKFLTKFKNKISVTGRDGFANIISTNTDDKIVNLEAKSKPSNAKNLHDWKEAYQERKKIKNLIYLL